MMQQMTSLRTLLRIVRHDGIYVIEDIGTSYLAAYGGGPIGQTNTTIDFLKQLIDDLQPSTNIKRNPELAKYVYSFDIGPYIVVFRIRKQ